MSVLDITSTLERDIFTTTSLAFNQAYRDTRTYWPGCSTRIKVNSKTIRFPFRGQLGSLKEFVDERQLEKIRLYEVSGDVKKWEKTLEVDRDDIADDNLGLLGPEAQELGITAALHPDELLWTEINTIISGGTSTVLANGFDSQPVFSASHAWTGVSGTQSNLLTSSADMSLATCHAAIQNAIETMKAFTGPSLDKNGAARRLGVRPNLLHVASNIYFDVKRTLVAGQQIVAGTTDVDYGSLNPLVGEGITLVENPYLTNGYWIMFDTTRAIKPFVFLDREPLEYGTQTTNATDDVFMREKFKYGVRARYNFIPGMWFFALAGDGT